MELWSSFGSKSLILQAFCRRTAPRELQKKANVVRNRADTFLKPFVGGFWRKKKFTKKSGSHFWTSKAMYVYYVHVLRAHRATQGACSTSGRHVVPQRPIRIALECRIRYFWSPLDQFCYFVFSSKFSILVELWSLYGSFYSVLRGVWRTCTPREPQKRADSSKTRPKYFLKVFEFFKRKTNSDQNFR